MRFIGNEICCGSYACLNAIQDPSIDLQLFEISTSTPFGIRHYEDGHFDRLITTYFDPNKGMNRALRLWGYHVDTYRFNTPSEASDSIRNLVGTDCPVVVGPINMEKLGYQIMPSLLKRMDHYVLLEFFSKTQVLCTDSEGFMNYQLGYRELEQYLSAEGILEADGTITVRRIKKEQNYVIKEILENSFKYAADNLRQAEECGEGSQAVVNCFDYLKRYKQYQWRLPLMYDIQYLKQRKMLQLFFIDILEKYGIRYHKQRENIKRIVAGQNDLLGRMFNRLRKGEDVERERVDEFAEMERMIVQLFQ